MARVLLETQCLAQFPEQLLGSGTGGSGADYPATEGSADDYEPEPDFVRFHDAAAGPRRSRRGARH